MAAQDLTTLAAAREFLQKQGSETSQDDVIESLITRASEEIMRWTEREFAPAVEAVVRTFETDPSGRWVSLAPYDLRAVDQVRIDTDLSSPITLTSGQYRLWPYPATDGVFTALRLDVAGAHSTWPTRLLEITGDWGWSTIPEDVEHWCIVTVSIWLRRDVAAFSSVYDEEGQLERPEALPQAVRAGLGKYRRMSSMMG